MLVKGGSTNVTTYFVLRTAADGTATTGATITSIDLQYVRSGAAPSAKVDATALAAADSVHADNKAIEIDATDAPGLYRVDWPDAAFAAGAREVILTVKLASSFTEHLRVEIDAIAGDASAANQTTIINHLTDVKGTGFVKDTDSLVDLAHTGADGDTLEELSDEIALVGGAVGSGSDSVTITLEDDDNNPVGSAEVWITSDADGDTVVAGTLVTNDAGQITFMLDAGSTYYRWAKKASVNFTNPTSFVAVSD